MNALNPESALNPEHYKIFDSHAHYDDERFKASPGILAELPQNGVVGVINCAVHLASSQTAVAYSKKYPHVFAAVGVHPENLADGPFDPALFAPLAEEPKTVAIGEIGLDYYWNKENKAEQATVLTQQLLFAKAQDLPVILHDRDAHNDMLQILQQFKPRGVLHCFSGSAEMAKQVLSIGLYLGVGGVLTFKNARKTAEVVRILPLDRLLLETDAPYLAPEPFRGKLNRSEYIYYVGRRVADLKGVPAEQVFNAALKNTKTLFSKIK